MNDTEIERAGKAGYEEHFTDKWNSAPDVEKALWRQVAKKIFAVFERATYAYYPLKIVQLVETQTKHRPVVYQERWYSAVDKDGNDWWGLEARVIIGKDLDKYATESFEARVPGLLAGSLPSSSQLYTAVRKQLFDSLKKHGVKISKRSA